MNLVCSILSLERIPSVVYLKLGGTKYLILLG